MLKIDHLTKKYGDYAAVNDLSLHIQPGEIYGFIGHNGAGKTTTLKCVAGILAYENGEITINGFDIQKNALDAKKVTAYIPDNPDIYDYMTAIQYLNFVADIFGVMFGRLGNTLIHTQRVHKNQRTIQTLQLPKKRLFRSANLYHHFLLL